ncbi:hypothetical protein KUTeg_022805 [Tegillarca granosa]|uniref:Uncharacterized protein n=1 Tax=Tegillarca granosa TaxID=220873 RepID=A0ABQ9E0T5_TEGGR|nr:hypothetical protein KUTeg_022805 [Tegillarca granosa]
MNDVTGGKSNGKHNHNKACLLQTMVCESAGKRRCVPQEEQCINQTCDTQEINHNSMMSQNYNLNTPSVQTQQNLISLNPDGHLSIDHSQQGELLHQHMNHQQHQISVTPMGDNMQSESGSHKQIYPQHQDTMVMDLHDETYSVADIDICDVNQACIMMDSDFVPNPEQYKPVESNKLPG